MASLFSRCYLADKSLGCRGGLESLIQSLDIFSPALLGASLSPASCQSTGARYHRQSTPTPKFPHVRPIVDGAMSARPCAFRFARTLTARRRSIAGRGGRRAQHHHRALDRRQPSTASTPPVSFARVAMLGNHLPRQCGIATFTTDLSDAHRRRASRARLLRAGDERRRHGGTPIRRASASRSPRATSLRTGAPPTS